MRFGIDDMGKDNHPITTPLPLKTWKVPLSLFLLV